ncbi:hypothetical protein [Massilia sp. NR 4-1]|uniref:hypothetical protein n=2 Tax=unclassified Massilia TaxID=2609279 RepID=UPI000AF40961|nr:hypothetical protein [Massilia sp. NR 4-1]
MDFPSEYRLNGKSYDMADLAFLSKGRNCYQFAYELNFSAHGKAFWFDAGFDNASGYIKHNFMQDYYNGKVFECNDPAAFQPLDIAIIAYSNPNAQDQPLVQSHHMICLRNQGFDSVHFAGTNNAGTLKDDLVLNACTLPESCVQLFSIPLGRTSTVVPGIDSYLKAGTKKFYVFRLPGENAFAFAKNYNWIKPKR